MSVFRNYNPHKAGDVNANAFPRVYPLPWEPTQRNVRSNPNIPSQPQRVQPHERGTFFGTSASSGGTLAPVMSSCGGCGCGGGCGSPSSSPAPTSSEIVTGHSLPGALAVRSQNRAHPRTTGAIRSGPPRASGKLRSMRLAPGGFLGGR